MREAGDGRRRKLAVLIGEEAEDLHKGCVEGDGEALLRLKDTWEEEVGMGHPLLIQEREDPHTRALVDEEATGVELLNQIRVGVEEVEQEDNKDLLEEGGVVVSTEVEDGKTEEAMPPL